MDILAPALAAIAVVVIYGLIACTAASELGSRTAAEDYYNRLVAGFVQGRLSLDLAPPAALAQLPDWSAAPDKEAIVRTFRFADFNAAFGFMARTALAAEKLDHHPEWSNVYNRVEVLLTTHDAHGVTELDVTLAALMDGFAKAADHQGEKP